MVGAAVGGWLTLACPARVSLLTRWCKCMRELELTQPAPQTVHPMSLLGAGVRGEGGMAGKTGSCIT